jgi:WD40 repeat protein
MSSAAQPNSILLWNMQTGQAITNLKLEGLAPIVSSLTFSPDGSKFVVASYINTTVWDTKTYTKLFTLSMTFKYDWALGTAFSPNGKLLGVFGRQRIYVWDMATQKQSSLIDGLGLDGVSMSFGTDSSVLISTDNSDTDSLPHVRLWDTHTGNNLGDFTNEDSPVLSPDGALLATYSHDGSGAVVIRAVQ